MAAVAGAPGSGEGGGEAEPDSEPISGWERPLEGSEGGERLRQPEEEVLGGGPEGNGQADGSEGALQARPWTPELHEEAEAPSQEGESSHLSSQAGPWTPELQEEAEAPSQEGESSHLSSQAGPWTPELHEEAEAPSQEGESSQLPSQAGPWTPELQEEAESSHLSQELEEPMQLGHDFKPTPVPCQEGPPPTGQVSPEVPPAEAQTTSTIGDSADQKEPDHWRPSLSPKDSPLMEQQKDVTGSTPSLCGGSPPFDEPSAIMDLDVCDSKPKSPTIELDHHNSDPLDLSSMASQPSPDVEEVRADSLHPQPMRTKQCRSEPAFEEVQEIQVGEHTEVEQPAIPLNVVQESEVEIRNTQAMASVEVPCLEDSSPVDLLQEPTAGVASEEQEVINTPGPISEGLPQIELEPTEVVSEHEKQNPEMTVQVQEPASESADLPEDLSLSKDSRPEVPETISELVPLVPETEPVVSEPDLLMHLQQKSPYSESPTRLSDPVPEILDESVAVEAVFNSVHEPSKRTLDLFDNTMDCVPEPLRKKIQHELDTVSVEEKVLALGVAEINQGVHPVTEQCTELGVEVKLFLQPVLKKLEAGPNDEDLNSGFHLVTHKAEFTSEETSVHLAPKVKSVLEPGDNPTLVEADVPVDNTVSSELKSFESERDSKCIKVLSEPRTEDPSEGVETVSVASDAEYDPFYRDTDNEMAVAVTDSVLVSDTKLEEQQVPMTTPDVAQCVDSKELCLEDTRPSSVDPDMVACLDNPNQCASPLLAPELLVAPEGIADLALGSEVQVTLDHIIQDALVVSFRHGDRIFSGVLMDLSKRFGPHGIPVTLHPKREYKNKPEESIQLQSTSFQEDTSNEIKNENGTAPADAPPDAPPVQSSEPCGVHNLWSSKPPPLFHEGAPYPPPLFIRDTYNQSIPQPPPRKIKRLKKKIYREEPTSIMNAIKLRPRQVLCDKCKNVVTDKREVRKTGTDSFKLEEGKRRRHDSVTTVNKKLKTDHKVNGKSQSESQKRNPVPKVANLGHGRGKVVKVAPQTNAPKGQLHTKKVLQSKNMDHAKAREVLKMAKEKAQKKQKETSSAKNSHNKVHFTRRLQNTSSGTLPPRLRIKPQRYRNEENDSSLKIGLDSLRSSNKIGIKPQTRHTATRSAGEAPSEIKSPSNGPQEASGEIENTSVCVPSGEQDEQQSLSKPDGKSNITVYMTLNQKKADSSTASVCSSADSTDDLKSTHSECSSTENFDFPPGSMHAPSSASSSSSKEEKKLSNSLKIKVFSKNVSKCMTLDGRTICVGDIVWAKIYGFPWWPARVLAITVSRKDNGLLVRQEARISWFGSPTTSFLGLSQLSPFLENFQSRFNKKRKGLYRKAITEAAKAAKQLTPEVRALLTQFET
ncbi:PWWP domain-containing protein 2A-like [Hyperolius riggenbachi]|uniref:PWWP domain-containing protein 2A-like n=1 Tax=Hyperolius riggenbachi TaxID=752182 RepID=UPI0035A27B59